MNDWKALQRRATEQGWRIVQTNRNHLKWYAPDGRTMLVSGCTTSDSRAIKNQRAAMRRAGFLEH